MVHDFKWIVEIIKSGGKITTSIAIACGFFLLVAHMGWLPPIELWMILLAIIGLMLFGSLAVVAILGDIPIKKWINTYKQKRAIREYIPHMTDRERKIISYLLAKNQKMFTGNEDGGYANTLISQGIIVCALRPGQPYSVVDTPFAIPDHIWSVLMKHKKDFPYMPPPPGENVVHPWRIPWMAR